MTTGRISKISPILPLTQLTYIYTVSRSDFSTTESRLKFWLGVDIVNGFNSVLISKSLSVRHGFSTFCSIRYEANNALVGKHTSNIKLKSPPIEQNNRKIILRTRKIDRDYNNYTLDSGDKSVDFIKTMSVLFSSIKTNSVLIVPHFHVLLARDGGQVCPQDHLEVGAKVERRLPSGDAIEKRNQISNESSTWTLTSSIATVIDDPDTVVTVVFDVTVVGMSTIEAVRYGRNGIVTASTAVIIVGTGARTRTGAAGCRTAYWSLIDPDEMGFNAMIGEQRNIRYHTMISKHQLAGTTTFSEEKTKYYSDNFHNYNKNLYSYLYNQLCCVIYHCNVTIYHPIRQQTNKTYYFTAINGSKSHNAKIIHYKFSIYFIIIFDVSFYVHFRLKGTYVYPFDKNVTDKGSLQNAMPDKTIIECFMSILSFLIKGSLRTQTKPKNLKPKIGNMNRMNSYNKTKIFTIISKALYCHSTYYANRLIYDVELNPGPVSGTNTKISLTIVTLNCRGLGSIDKFRLVLNKAQELITKGEAIIMLQETMVANDNYLKLAWRGNSVFTPGTGNSLDCITLTNASSNISLINQIGNRGHYFTYSSPLITTAIIMNLYAPQGFDEAKTNFFIDNFNVINNYDCDIIVGGDMNVTLSPNDRHCRGVTNAELILAEEILEYQQALGLEDTWQSKKGYTWQKGQTMSKLDRIFYRITNFKLKSNKVDWTLAKTDHAAVVAKFEHEQNVTHKSSHVKLDNDILKDIAKLNELKEYVSNQLNDPQVATFNPHVKLEFAKMTIRTKALDIMASCRKKTNEQLNELNKDIITNTRLLSSENDIQLKNMLLRDLERLKVQKDAILDARGKKLASLAKTKWYNEGEKSNKYFLNMLK
jgi:hypothetical protein